MQPNTEELPFLTAEMIARLADEGAGKALEANQSTYCGGRMADTLSLATKGDYFAAEAPARQAFARHCAEAGARAALEAAHMDQVRLDRAIVDVLAPYYKRDERALDWDVLPQTIRRVMAELDNCRVVHREFVALIERALDSAGAPKYHPDNGAPARKPMTPQERIAFLAAKDMVAGDGWRVLQLGETVEVGDEYLGRDAMWHDASKFAGIKIEDKHLMHRRKAVCEPPPSNASQPVSEPYKLDLTTHLARSGFRPLNPSEAYHRAADWTADLLPPGWRPCLEDEVQQKGDEFQYQTGWRESGKCSLPCSAYPMYLQRTRRPLPDVALPPIPENYRLATEAERQRLPDGAMYLDASANQWAPAIGPMMAIPLYAAEGPFVVPLERIPLTAADIRPGDVLRKSRWNDGFCYPLRVAEDGILYLLIDSNARFATYHSLMNDGWQISRDGGKTWGPCSKAKEDAV